MNLLPVLGPCAIRAFINVSPAISAGGIANMHASRVITSDVVQPEGLWLLSMPTAHP